MKDKEGKYHEKKQEEIRKKKVGPRNEEKK